MHGSDIISLLLYEAGRKSEIAALVKRVEALTDEEIASAPVPLPWYRKALTELRKRSIAERLADVMVRASNGTNPDVSGIVRRCLGPLWVKGRFSQLQVLPGQLVFFPEAGGMWIGTSYFEEPDQELLRNGEYVTATTFSIYKMMEKERIAMNVATSASSSDIGPTFGVRITRT